MFQQLQYYMNAMSTVNMEIMVSFICIVKFIDNNLWLNNITNYDILRQ